MSGQILLDRPILVVDDANSTRYSTTRFLRAAGAEVIEATTGQQALELAPRCGAVVLDINLPDIDGFEVCRRLRAGAVNSRVPVVHLSAQRLRDEDRIRGLDSGADAYLIHPADSAVLVATLNALLRARAAEAAELESRRRFEAVFRTAPVGIALVGADFELIDSNAEMQRILGADAGSIAPPDLRSIVRSLVDQCDCATDAEFHAAKVLTTSQSGGDVFLDCRVTDLGHSTKLLLAVDVTRKRLLEVEREALLRSERSARQLAENASHAKDSFLALLSHELRNPLAPISSAAKLLQMAPGDAAVVQRASGVIDRQVRHITELVDDLMDVSRVTRGLVDLDLQPAELRAVAQAAVEQVRPLIDAREHAFEVVAPDEPLVVLADRTRLIQVVANLLNNAAKYTPPGGRIALALSTEDAEGVVQVRDTGVGMSDALRPHVFDLFTQGERTLDRSQGGLGVGLALVKSIVNLHGGRVEAASDGVGCGSEFTVRLPLAEPDAAGARATRTSAGAGATRPLSVLLVDDNVDAAAMLADVMRLAGHFVTVANDAADAVGHAAASGAHFDAFVLDIGLPGMNGYELARQLRGDPRWQHTVFLALTGYGQADDHEQSRLAGFDRHLVKPVDESVLLATIGEIDATAGAPAAPR